MWVGGREVGGRACEEAFCGRDRKRLDLYFMMIGFLSS